MPGYKITNMVGEIQTRMHRWKSPTTHRSKQIIGELRVLPGKPAELREEVFKIHEKTILQKVKNGELMVTCPDGTTITSTHGGELIYRKPGGQVEVKEVPTPVFEAPKVLAPEAPKKEASPVEDTETLRKDIWTSAESAPVEVPEVKVEKKEELKPHYSSKKGKK
jgi:hypothetical protein